jgi:hypothetical protein
MLVLRSTAPVLYSSAPVEALQTVMRVTAREPDESFVIRA